MVIPNIQQAASRLQVCYATFIQSYRKVPIHLRMQMQILSAPDTTSFTAQISRSYYFIHIYSEQQERIEKPCQRPLRTANP